MGSRAPGAGYSGHCWAQCLAGTPHTSRHTDGCQPSPAAAPGTHILYVDLPPCNYEKAGSTGIHGRALDRGGVEVVDDHLVDFPLAHAVGLGKVLVHSSEQKWCSKFSMSKKKGNMSLSYDAWSVPSCGTRKERRKAPATSMEFFISPEEVWKVPFLVSRLFRCLTIAPKRSHAPLPWPGHPK